VRVAVHVAESAAVCCSVLQWYCSPRTCSVDTIHGSFVWVVVRVAVRVAGRVAVHVAVSFVSQVRGRSLVGWLCVGDEDGVMTCACVCRWVCVLMLSRSARASGDVDISRASQSDLCCSVSQRFAVCCCSVLMQCFVAVRCCCVLQWHTGKWRRGPSQGF